MRVLETKHLLIRHFEPGDLDALFALYSDAEIRRYIPEGMLTVEETREELEYYLQYDSFYGREYRHFLKSKNHLIAQLLH